MNTRYAGVDVWILFHTGSSQTGGVQQEEEEGWRMKAGGYCSVCIHGSFAISCLWVVAHRYCSGSLEETQLPLPWNQKPGIKRIWCAFVFMSSSMSGKLLANEQVGILPVMLRQNITICAGSSKSSLITLTSHWTGLYSSINNSVKPTKQTGSGPRQGKQAKKEQKHKSAFPTEIKSLSLTSYQT